MTLEEELRQTINRHGAESRSNTPDFILAKYLLDCLRAFELSSIAREEWYGVQLRPGETEALRVSQREQREARTLVKEFPR